MKVDLRDTDVGIHVVYPGVIDTELFHLPGNDPLPATGVEMLPVDAMVEPVLGAIETGQFEVSRPRLVRRASTRASTRTWKRFLDGTIAFVRSPNRRHTAYPRCTHAGSGVASAGRPMVLVSRYSSKPATPCSRPWPLSL